MSKCGRSCDALALSAGPKGQRLWLYGMKTNSDAGCERLNRSCRLGGVP